MILGGMALAFSRVIDNSVISLENIYRHLEMGALPRIAAEVGGAEVSLAVLAATLVDVQQRAIQVEMRDEGIFVCHHARLWSARGNPHAAASDPVTYAPPALSSVIVLTPPSEKTYVE
jgi:hypothetical protein